jgi:propionate CoA-transferase
VVVAKPENHWQTFSVQYDPAFSNEIRARIDSIPSMEMSERKIIARRAALELNVNSIVNLGIGMPEGIANVTNEEKIADLLTLTAEPGVIGGIPAGGLNFGAAVNAQTVIDQPYQFDFYDGGGLDAAFLGLAQADSEGNLNVSKFGPRLAGAGGFINISQNAKKLVFVGTFTAGRLAVAIENGSVRILNEGASAKFVREVEHRTFSGPYSVKRGQPVLYVTERCVFKLTPDGLELVEVAPGIDIERDILARMEFRPIIRNPAIMDKRIFAAGPMGLREQLLRMPIEQRVTYHANENLFFVNLEGHSIRSHEDVEQARRTVEDKLVPLGHKVYAIVNYDNFEIFPDVLDEYMTMVAGLVERFYSGVTRYTTSSFLRAKLGDALKRRAMAPHIYETEEEATAQLGSKRKTAPHR